MRIEDFTKTCNYLKKSRFKFDNPDNCGDNNKVLDYCRSVIAECKATMNDKDLDVMLGEYYENLFFTDAPEEMGEVMRLREEVCRRLAEKSFRQYGRQWAETLENLIVTEDPDSLGLYEKCIDIYERLSREYGEDDNYEHRLAECCYSAARFCDLHWMHGKAIEYCDKALELYWKLNRGGESHLHDIVSSYQLKGESCIGLKRYGEAKEYFTKALDIYKQESGIRGPKRAMHIYGYSVEFCRLYMEKIRKLESIPEAGNTNKC